MQRTINKLEYISWIFLARQIIWVVKKAQIQVNSIDLVYLKIIAEMYC